MNVSRRILRPTLVLAGWLAATSAIAAVKVISLPTNRLVFDTHRGLIYASVPSRAGDMGNSVTAINPSLGVIVASVFVGSEPDVLALSDDGQSLYVGLDGAGAVRRINLATLTAGSQFPLGGESFSGPRNVGDLAVQPSHPDVVAVSFRDGGVAIYDQGVQRPQTLNGFAESDRIVFSPDPGLLYQRTFLGLTRARVDPQGVSEIDTTYGLFNNGPYGLVQASGLLFAASGEVVNPAGPTLLGTFVSTDTSFFNSTVLAEPAKDRATFLREHIDTFRISTFTPMDSLSLPAESSGDPSDLVRWGSEGLAYRTSGDQVVILGDEPSSAPPPPAGPWLSSPNLPGFEVKSLINDTAPGLNVPACIAETLCVSGALADRPEVFVKVIGPRPNGFLWAQLSRFTPSKVEVWLRQKTTNKINYYLLAPVSPEADDVSGLQDRGAFQP